MSVTTDVVDGRPVLLIEGADGKTKTYRFKVEDRTGCWSCVLRQGSGKAYAVAFELGLWRCTCPDWKYRPDRTERPCKHVLAAQGLRELIESMNTDVE